MSGAPHSNLEPAIVSEQGSGSGRWATLGFTKWQPGAVSLLAVIPLITVIVVVWSSSSRVSSLSWSSSAGGRVYGEHEGITGDQQEEGGHAHNTSKSMSEV